MDKRGRGVAYSTVVGFVSMKSGSKDDPRSLRTRAALREAFIALVEASGFQAVSVADVCARAGVNRTTFYLHYPDKHALLEECLLDFLSVPQDLIDRYADVDQVRKTPIYMKHVAERCTRRKVFFLGILEDGQYPAYYALFSRHLSSGVRLLIDTLIEEMNLPEERPSEACLVFLNSAFLGSLLHWVRSGSAEGIDSFCEAMMAYAVAVLRAGLGR
jgi:AcrR family transcriptional regulator